MKPCIRYVQVHVKKEEEVLLKFLGDRGSVMDFSTVRFELNKEQAIYILCCYPETADGLEKFGKVLATCWKELPVEIKRKIGKRLETSQEVAVRGATAGLPSSADGKALPDKPAVAPDAPQLVACDADTAEADIACPIAFAGVDE